MTTERRSRFRDVLQEDGARVPRLQKVSRNGARKPQNPVRYDDLAVSKLLEREDVLADGSAELFGRSSVKRVGEAAAPELDGGTAAASGFPSASRLTARSRRNLRLGETKSVWADFCSVGLRASPSL